MFGSGNTTFITPNKDMDDIMKVVKSIKESVYQLNTLAKELKEKQKNKKRKSKISRNVIRHFRC